MKMKLNKIQVSIDELILDPNNPRFSKNEHDLIQNEKMFADPDVQSETLAKMVSDNEFDVTGLEKSIKSNGFVSIVQPLLVRKIGDKYLVIEGNRRTSALKQLRRKHGSGKPKDELSASLLATMDAIEVVDCTGASKDDIDLLLGMIHVGGTRDWELLPSSFYLYKLYSELLSKKEKWNISDVESKFYYDVSLAKTVAEKASIKLSSVRDSLKVYRLYKQLHDELEERGTLHGSDFNHRKASFIKESVNGKVLEQYFGFNANNYQLSDEGIDKWINLILGDGEVERVILTPNTGDSTLRDFKKILSDGDAADEDRVVVDREPTSKVKADVIARKIQRNLNSTLKTVKGELDKINIAGLKSFSNADKELLEQIQLTITLIQGRV